MAVTFPSDLEIARRARLLPMPEIAAKMGIGAHLLEPYGYDAAKIRLEAMEELADRPKAKYVVVSAITPTPLGEGKTTTTVGLGQALSHIGKRSTVAIRQPSMGPTFGIKGGAAGGGYSQVVPMERLNLHLTGDMHAITAAHNLLAAMIDNHIHHHEALVDRDSVTWRRVLDVSDRVLRNVIVGLGTREDGVIRQTGFDITAASEVMTVLALTTSLRDMRARLGRIVIGNTTSGKPITAEELFAAGAMTVILRDAIKPNLLQTLENTPVLVHAGPFGNIATGNSSVIADLIGIRCGDFLVTEAGFGADMGAERHSTGVEGPFGPLQGCGRQAAAAGHGEGEPGRCLGGCRQPSQAGREHTSPRSDAGGRDQRLSHRPSLRAGCGPRDCRGARGAGRRLQQLCRGRPWRDRPGRGGR
jgi:formate--tetrahydrofolate ligase